MTDYAVEYAAAQEITRLHTRVVTELAASAETMPTDIDGGVGADLLLSILAPIATASGELAAVQETAAATMEDTVHQYRGIEEDAEEAFRRLAEAIK